MGFEVQGLGLTIEFTFQGARGVNKKKIYIYIWVVVKIMVPFWVP